MEQVKPTEISIRKPGWLGRPLPSAPTFSRTRSLLDNGRLHTVCQEARCPNCGKCFSRGTAAFLILGDCCTRCCRFCAVTQGTPARPDPDEPGRIAEAASRMGLDYVVVTSVTRDDLPDGGAGAVAETIRCLRSRLPSARIEVLVPDFQGDEEALATVLEARPDVLNHNLETVARLYPEVRPQAIYARSLELLRRASSLAPGIAVKSGLMLGLGERPYEVEAALRDPSEHRVSNRHSGAVSSTEKRLSRGCPLCSARGIRRLAGGCLKDRLYTGGQRPSGPQLLPRRGT